MPEALNIKDLLISYKDDEYRLDDIKDISIQQGEKIGILGESGCGKTTFGRALIGLLNKNEYHRLKVKSINTNHRMGGSARSGSKYSIIEYSQNPELLRDNNIFTASKKQLRDYRKEVQMAFQNPRSSLNLEMTVRKILEEAVMIGDPSLNRKGRDERVMEYAERFDIGGDHWNSISDSKPRNLSGGQRRRVSIAKVFASQPSIIVADEPVASLDVSIRGKILNAIQDEWKTRYRLWTEGKKKYPLTLIIITHDYELITGICDKILVFYGDIQVRRGTIVEIIQDEELKGYHPYTKSLEAANVFLRDQNSKIAVHEYHQRQQDFDGSVGCIYSHKCPKVVKECRMSNIPLIDYKGNKIKCISLP